MHLHSIYFTGPCRRRGRLAENFYYSQYGNLHRGFALRSKVFPFLVAAVDFLEEITDQHSTKTRYRLVEIKSADSTPPLKRIQERKKRLVELQIQTAMGIFNIYETLLVLIKVNDIKKQDFEVHSFNKRDYSGFLESHSKEIVCGYVKCILAKYLKTYFGISLTSSETKRMIDVFLQHATVNAEIQKSFNLSEQSGGSASFDATQRGCIESFRDKFKSTYKSNWISF